MTLLAVATFCLGSVGVYLVLSRRLFETIVGLSLLAHAANLVVLAGTAEPNSTPALHGGGATIESMADPLPQAMVLTAIVISMAVTIYLLALLVANAGPPETGDRKAKSKGAK